MSEEQQELLALLGEVWALVPSQRLGQLVVNASGDSHDSGGSGCSFATPDANMREGSLKLKQLYSALNSRLDAALNVRGMFSSFHPYGSK